MKTLDKKISSFFSIKVTLFARYSLCLSNSFFVRIIIVVVLNIIYYSFQWETLRILLGQTIAWMFTNLAGMETTFNFPGFNGVLKGVTWISAACLYIDIYAYTLPFIYDRKKPVFKNIFKILIFIGIIQIINIARIYFSVFSFISFKTTWFIAHTIPDTLLWYPIVIGTMLFGALKFTPKSIIIEKIKKESELAETK